MDLWVVLYIRVPFGVLFIRVPLNGKNPRSFKGCVLGGGGGGVGFRVGAFKTLRGRRAQILSV